MGADDKTCGMIAAIPVLAAMIQFVSPIIIERMEQKKTIIIVAAFLHRFLLGCLIFMPILPLTMGLRLIFTALVYLISYSLVSFATPAVSNMIISFVPQNIRGSYFGLRESYILIFSTILNLVIGKVLDIYKTENNEYGGYVIMYILIFIFTYINFLSFMSMKEVKMKRPVINYRIKDVFTKPLNDRKFFRIIILFFLWSIGLQIGAPFFGVYMVSGLKLDYSFITINGMIFSICYAVMTRIWGKLADKKSWLYVAITNIAILSVSHFMWVFIYAQSPILRYMVVVVHIMGGIAWAGVNISLFNLPFDYIPDEGRTLYLGFNAALSGIVGFGAAMLSSNMVGRFGDFETMRFGFPVGILQIILSASGIMTGICVLYIKLFVKAKNI
jgi:Na+/melibiose symporter-like transporter